MNIFNSLGSNYTFLSTLRILFSTGGKRAQSELVTYLERRYGGKAILTYKGRDALTLALKALPEKGRVAFNGYTCLAVYESITESGHQPLYLDISPQSLDFSPETLRTALEKHTDVQAVIIQNTLGFPCDIVAIERLCRERGLPLIEDLAHSIGTRYADGREAGTVGDFVIFSFSQDKVVDAVSGGALIVRNNEYSASSPTEKVSIGQQMKDRFYPILTWKVRFAYLLGVGKLYHALLRSLGILSSPFGEKYGPRMLPDWYCATILWQFRNLERTAAHRKAIADTYAREINVKVHIPTLNQGASNLRFPIMFPQHSREMLIEYLKLIGVHVSDIWYDAPIAPKKYTSCTGYAGECPEAEKVSGMMLNLPTHVNVSTADAERIATLINNLAPDIKVNTPNDRRDWEAFISEQKPHSFLHSWTWGEQAERSGSKVFRMTVREHGKIIAAALFIKINARRGSFLLCPHGPVLSPEADQERLLKHVITPVIETARKEGCAFIRICPLAKNDKSNNEMYRALGFRDAPIHMHPELAWILDITKSEDDLLREMRKTTRYLIKRMEKEGVEITQSSDPEDIEKFWPVYEATVQRQQFTPFGKENLRKEFELFAKDGQAAFFFGKYKGDIIAAAIIIFYNGSAYYHHSGSIQKSKDINASYLLQWRVIQEAKRRGCTLYNFWGISPADRPKHPWAGLSLFKKGFGGFAEEYLHAQDKPLTAKYALNYAIETVRRIRRGL